MTAVWSLVDRLCAKQTVYTCTLDGGGNTGSPLGEKVVFVNPDGLDAANAILALKDALGRVCRNFDLLVAGKPVRDVAETRAEVLAALAKVQ